MNSCREKLREGLLCARIRFCDPDGVGATAGRIFGGVFKTAGELKFGGDWFKESQPSQFWAGDGIGFCPILDASDPPAKHDVERLKTRTHEL